MWTVEYKEIRENEILCIFQFIYFFFSLIPQELQPPSEYIFAYI